MNIYALAFGLFLAMTVMVIFRSRQLDNSTWAFPIFLATFPAYYWLFALYAFDYTALLYEFIAGSAFLGIAYLAWRIRSFTTWLLLALGYVAHAAYDIYHDALFINSGVPGWWPEFCAAVDVLLGGYIAYLTFLLCNGRLDTRNLHKP